MQGFYNPSEKMQLNVQQRVNGLKMKVQAVTITTPLTSKRTLSPASTVTGLSPVAKRSHQQSHAARELFPSSPPTTPESTSERQYTTDLPQASRPVPGQLFTATRLLPRIVPKPAKARIPLSSQENARIPKPMMAHSPSRIPVMEEITIDDTDNADVMVC